jgi:hypothetical protein
MMGYTNVALINKVREMYPEVQKHHISFGLDYSDDKKAYVIKFTKEHHELTTYLDKKEADECMDGVKCVHLGVKLGEFIKNFESL